MRRFLLSLPLLLAASSAWAACGVTSVQVKDNAGATPSYAALNDGTNCAGETGLIWGGAALSLANALPVQPGTGATFPVSGSVTVSGTVAATQSGTWNINNISGTISLPTGAATSAKQPAIGTAGTASADVLTVQGITSMTPLKVDGTGGSFPVSGTVTANQGGAPWTVTGTGTAGSAATGVLTVQGTASMTKLLVTPDANSSVNVNQIGGSSVSTAATGVQKVGVVGNAGATLDGTVAAGTAPTNGVAALGVYNSTLPAPTNGQSVALQVDANGGLRKSLTSCPNTINIAQTATTDVHTFTHFGYICTIMLVSATAQSIGIREGTGTTCATSPTSLIGDSSGTAEVALAANGGFSLPMGAAPMRLAASADHLCVEQSSTGEVAGTITYADLAN